MTGERCHNNPTKTEQLATWLLAQGKSMTAKEAFEAGFRFMFEAKTTPQTIASLLNKLHENSRYSVDRHYREGDGARVTSVHVIAALKKRTVERGMGSTEMLLWNQLLTRPLGTPIQGVA